MIEGIIALLIALNSLILPCSCEKKKGNYTIEKLSVKIKRVGTLDPEIDESSGLIKSDSNKSFWTINDGGGKTALYQIEEKGKIIQTLPLPDVSNYDWEDLTVDDKGNIFIGDFGNNNNSRKNLKIYIYSTLYKTIDTILFDFEDQLEFPPEKSLRNFDCEAFFWYKDTLLLFSKNRAGHLVKTYKVPARKGYHKAIVSQKLYFNNMITGASFDPINKICVLIGYGKLYGLKLEEQSTDLQLKQIWCKNFVKSGQAEAISFINKDELLITNEQRKIFKARIKSKY